LLEGTIPAHQEAIDHGGLLPELPIQHINLYGAASVRASYVGDLARVIRQGYAALRPVQLRSAG